jgi:uncharacterized membrane protein YozB (DUF420 family)
MILSCVGPRNQTGRTSDLILAKHSLNRVFLPIWLYVSVTGVVIFLLLRA